MVKPTCPKCKEEMTWGYTWIQHGDMGHPGPQTWVCKCGYVEPIKIPDFEVTSYPVLNKTVWVK